MSHETVAASAEGFLVLLHLHGEPQDSRNLHDNWQGKPCYQTALFWPDDSGGEVDPLPDGGAPPPAHEKPR